MSKNLMRQVFVDTKIQVVKYEKKREQIFKK